MRDSLEGGLGLVLLNKVISSLDQTMGVPRGSIDCSVATDGIIHANTHAGAFLSIRALERDHSTNLDRTPPVRVLYADIPATQQSSILAQEPWLKSP